MFLPNNKTDRTMPNRPVGSDSKGLATGLAKGWVNASPSPLPPQQNTWQRLTRQLSVRIWLAVLGIMSVLILLVGGAYHLAGENRPPMREVVVRNDAGEVVGTGLLIRRGSRLPSANPSNPSPSLATASWTMSSTTTTTTTTTTSTAKATPTTSTPSSETASPTKTDPPPSHGSDGPEFIVAMNDGTSLHLHLPRPGPRPNNRLNGFGFLTILLMVGVAVALATYPIMRKLTRRLEALQTGVEHWGEGHLSARVQVHGHDEVAFLAEKFNQAAERLERLVQSHKALLANASHELRSPLTRIRMALSMGEQALSPTLQAEAQRSLQELDTLIEEILLASRLDAKEVDLGAAEVIDLTGLAAEVCADFNANLIPCPSPTEVCVKGTPKLLRRAIRNLLENGQRHGQRSTPTEVKGGPSDPIAASDQAEDRVAAALTVTLRVESHPTADTDNVWAMLSVSDQGPGVPDAYKSQIFEPFFRLPGASESSGGVGLGLALVKSIAERHGGEVRCEDNPSGGAQFVLKLPLIRP